MSDGDDWDGPVPPEDQEVMDEITRRGYGGHAMLGSLGLIHMNGRVFDAILGRFLSPGPFVPEPGFTQSHNRYSYVFNNPLSFIDPSGFNPEGTENDIDEITVIGERIPFECPAPNIVVIYNDFTVPDCMDLQQAGLLQSIFQWEYEWQDEVPGTYSPYGRSLLVSAPRHGPFRVVGRETTALRITVQVAQPQSRQCYAPFTGGDSYLSNYAARVGNLVAGVLDSFSGGIDLGAQISGSVNIFSIKPGFSAGVFNGNLSLTGAGNLTLSVKSPTPGRLTYGEASLSIGPVKVGTASASVTEGISTRTGSFSQANDGFSGMARMVPAIRYNEDRQRAGLARWHVRGRLRVPLAIPQGVGVEVQCVSRRKVSRALEPRSNAASRAFGETMLRGDSFLISLIRSPCSMTGSIHYLRYGLRLESKMMQGLLASYHS